MPPENFGQSFASHDLTFPTDKKRLSCRKQVDTVRSRLSPPENTALIARLLHRRTA
jgi:hypothetical protein